MRCLKHDWDYFPDEGCPLCRIERMSDEEFAVTFSAILDMAEKACDEAEQILKVQL